MAVCTSSLKPLSANLSTLSLFMSLHFAEWYFRANLDAMGWKRRVLRTERRSRINKARIVDSITSCVKFKGRLCVIEIKGVEF